MTQRMGWWILGVVVAVVPAVFASSQAPATAPAGTPGAQAAGDAPVFRVSVTSVQVDAVVTDARGRRITDLTADDFEVLQDGRPQPIRTFRYVPGAPPPALTRPGPPTPRGLPDGPGLLERNTLRRDEVRRSIAIVVDDLGLSFTSLARSREAVKRFIETSLQPGDVATVVRTSAGVGTLQQFTSNKAVLNVAADRIQYSLMSRYASDWGSSIAGELIEEGDEGAAQPIMGERDFRASMIAVGTLGAVNFVVRGMQELPGRKAIVLVTDGFELFNRDRPNLRGFEMLRRLVDAANRSFVVLYTLDAKGLVNLGADASQRESDLDGTRRRNTQQRLWNSQHDPSLLAQATGGLAFRNTNDLGTALDRVLDDQLGYYLLGFDPGPEAFAPGDRAPRFHELRVRVRRPGATVRARSGYFGITDTEYQRQNALGSRLARALASPFTDQRIALRITPMFVMNEKGRPMVRAMTHLDAHALAFAPQPAGGFKSRFQIMAVAVDENGAVRGQSAQTYDVSAKQEPSVQERADGFVHSLDVPVGESGPYMFRVAVADTASETMGSAQQFLVVPPLGRGRLLLSSVLLRQDEACGAPPCPATLPADAGPALRRFAPPARLDLGFEVYNAQVDARRPGDTMTSTIRIYQEGREALALPSEPVDTSLRGANDRIVVRRALRLSRTIPPGDYQLKVTVTEQRSGRSPRTASQWVDFTVRAPAGAPPHAGSF